MIIEHIKASDLETNNWSGGTTTQLAIYPKDADYKKLNFQFRISTASVECEESTFTKLPGISRKLMILNGEIKIEHKNQYLKNLKKFEQDEFSGDWDTISYGKAIDFNLMTTENTYGEIEAISINKATDLYINKNIDCYSLYLFSGKMNISINDKNIEIEKGDIILLFPNNNEQNIKINTNVKSEIILSRINFNTITP